MWSTRRRRWITCGSWGEANHELLALKDNYLQQQDQERQRHGQEMAALREELNDAKKRHVQEMHAAKTKDSINLEVATKRYAVCTNKKDTRIDQKDRQIGKLRMDHQNEIGKLQQQIARLKGENKKLEEKVTALEENNEALRKRQDSSDRYGKNALVAYDNLNSGNAKRPRDMETEERFRVKAGKHFGIEPSGRMMSEYKRNFPHVTGVMRSPSRSRSPSPCR